ncbi:2-oxoacid:acceptor oxidoreductase subunit alpha [Dehalogenimonas sp. THU2]|uniref:2-oxoacid:acceptor oxidoreductase subunit alpha n=1 Tax=Dehalogenimonas sp. THU2 TaxID=3151121 RepID=UPI003218A307
MSTDLNILVGGEAGQGVQSVGSVLARAMMRGGYEVFADQDFESRIRGGNSFTRVRISSDPVQSPLEKADMVVALNAETIDLHLSEIRGGGIIIYDGEKTGSKPDKGVLTLDIPIEKIAEEKAGSLRMTNTVASAAALGLLDYDLEILIGVLREEYGRHGDKVVEGNIKAAKAGYEFAQQHRPKDYTERLKAGKSSGKMLISGNEAVALGALAAGCRFVAGYPMTPSTPILEYLADKGREFRVLVIQAEDEISAINMAVGAGFTGARSMVATSGGGFCLMVEGLSLAGMTETPVVIVLGQRAGPSTGLPTRTEQGELLFALHAGHGEFPRFIAAPANAEEAFWLTVKAFNMAEKYQSPAIILTDHEMADSYYTVTPFDLDAVVIERGDLLTDKEANKAGEYKRYAYTKSGISPRAFPGQGKALVVADSDEHSEAGHIIEDAETRRLMVEKRMRKHEGLQKEVGEPAFHHREKAKFNLIGWGSSRGAIEEAACLLEANGVSACVIHFNELWPFPAEVLVKNLAGVAKNIVIESNATGQLGRLIRTETSIKMDGHIARYDGRPLSAEYIVEHFEREVA